MFLLHTMQYHLIYNKEVEKYVRLNWNCLYLKKGGGGGGNVS